MARDGLWFHLPIRSFVNGPISFQLRGCKSQGHRPSELEVVVEKFGEFQSLPAATHRIDGVYRLGRRSAREGAFRATGSSHAKPAIGRGNFAVTSV